MIDGPKGPSPKRPDEWGELERDPKFQESLLSALQVLIRDKKFGADIVDEHERLLFRREFENDKGIVEIPEGDKKRLEEAAVNSAIREGIDPLIPEIVNFVQKLVEFRTVEELLRFAKKEGVEVTQEELAEQKKIAIEILKH